MVNAYTSINQLEPAMAAYIDGVGYLEEVITGYRTLRVEGREPLDLDLERIEISTRDGARHKRRRIESRTLTIYFALTADSPEFFATKFNLLKSCLYKVKESQIIFDDEPDKYFVGTYKTAKVTYPGNSASTGEVTIECADPFKYAISETTVEMETVEGKKVLIADYGGTYPAHPILTAVSEESDNGFYGFVHSNGARLQIGDPGERDQEEETNPDNAETIFDYVFNSQSIVNNNWTANNANLQRWSNDYVQTGSVSVATHYIYPTKPSGIYSYYFGPALKHTFTQEEGTHQNFDFTFRHWFQPTAADQAGGFDLYINTAAGVNVCGVSVWKDKNADIMWTMFANGSRVKNGRCTIKNNPFAGWITHKIQKIKSKLDFTWGGNRFAIDVPDLETVEVGEISMIFYFAPNANPIEANNALMRVAFRSIPNTWIDVKNKISEGAVIEVDTGSGEITSDGTAAYELGAINNEYEAFRLEPGENTITCAASDWVTDDTYTMKYREVYL